ncbi:hypothetical protein FG379_002939 [Cryptosporidium bovis]|uniref:uncharacterized protein n=1 Tax=Cryptosporidium bovis TaxID=310047 RepID=UPI003519E62A|nr:hypothetical protein FG379_002939 [Cryptosporidium bovis]
MQLLKSLVILILCFEYVLSEGLDINVSDQLKSNDTDLDAVEMHMNQRNGTLESPLYANISNDLLVDFTDSEIVDEDTTQNVTSQTPLLFDSSVMYGNETLQPDINIIENVNNDTQAQMIPETNEKFSDIGVPPSEEGASELMLIQQGEISENQSLEKNITVESSEKNDIPSDQDEDREIPRKSRLFVNRKLSTPDVEKPINLIRTSQVPLIPENGSTTNNFQETSNYLPIVIKRILPAFAPENHKENISTGTLIGNSAEASNILRNSIGNLSGFSSILSLNDRFFESENTPIRTKAHFTSTQLTIIQDHSKSSTTESRGLNSIKSTQLQTEEKNITKE